MGVLLAMLLDVQTFFSRSSPPRAQHSRLLSRNVTLAHTPQVSGHALLPKRPRKAGDEPCGREGGLCEQQNAGEGQQEGLGE
eukprot:1157271-Pelagomonas_calceolata.AAC.11